MINKRLVYEYLKDNNFEFVDNPSNGIKISLDNGELLIKGEPADLVEFADYLVSLAISEGIGDHVHLDDSKLLDKESEIKDFII